MIDNRRPGIESVVIKRQARSLIASTEKFHRSL